MRGRLSSLAFAATLCVGCEAQTATPIAPTSTGSTVDISGTWVQVEGGGTREWTVDQAGGRATFAQTDHPTLGDVTGAGGVFGAAVLGSYRFAETYEGLTTSASTTLRGCYLDTAGDLRINGATMTGVVTETIGCGGGVRVSQVTRTLTMRRK
jgi:hypothetical protein